MKAYCLSLLFLTITLACGSSGFAQSLVVYEAEYRAKAAGLSATAERKLESLGGNSYRLNQAMTVRVLGAKLGEIEETSQFTYLDGNLVPDNYSYVQSGVSRKIRTSSSTVRSESSTLASKRDRNCGLMP